MGGAALHLSAVQNARALTSNSAAKKSNKTVEVFTPKPSVRGASTTWPAGRSRPVRSRVERVELRRSRNNRRGVAKCDLQNRAPGLPWTRLAGEVRLASREHGVAARFVTNAGNARVEHPFGG
jgi:hypothetical protein